MNYESEQKKCGGNLPPFPPARATFKTLNTVLNQIMVLEIFLYILRKFGNIKHVAG